jgi:branched-chain amino acid transport system substrate-binding protein
VVTPKPTAPGFDEICGGHYAFGHSVQRSTEEAIKAAGGTIKGAAVYPFPTSTDFSSYLLAAQSSGANVIGLCNSSADFINCVKQRVQDGNS